MSVPDLLAFIAFFAVVISLAIWKSRRARDHAENSADFFLGGRSLSWPLIGISIVAANISTEQMVGMAGQAAGATGLAVSNWQLAGSVGIVIIAMTLLPRFLRAGIYTMPEFLEYRYNAAARAFMAILTVIIYAVVMLPAVLYSGGVTLRAIAGIELVHGVALIGLIGVVYSAFGGLKAIAWADLIQGLALLAGGMLVFFLGLKATGGWSEFSAVHEDKLHMVLPSDDPSLPWTGVVGGMWIVLIYYCGLNQFIVQRNLAARTLRDGQLGMIFAGALWLLVPFAIVMPGLMAKQLYGDQLATADAAFPTLIKELIKPGIRGIIYAAIAGAVTSTLASLLNSSSTIATMDVWKRLLHPGASQTQLVWTGRSLTIVFMVIGCIIAPILDDPAFGGVFQFIQQFQGYIWPGVVAAFIGAFLLPRAPGTAGITALVGGPVLYGAFQAITRQGLFADKEGEFGNALLFRASEGGLPSITWESTAGLADNPSLYQISFLLQVLAVFIVLAMLMVIIAKLAPLPEPRKLPVREDIAVETDRVVKISGALVIVGVAVFYLVFW